MRNMILILFFGIANIVFTQSVTTTIYPTASNFNSGYVKSSGTKFSDDMQVSTSTSYGRGWVQFPLSSIPSSSTINSVTIIFYTFGGTSSSFSNTITGFTGDPISMSGSTLFTTIGAGTVYNTSTWTVGSTVSPSLNIKTLAASSFVEQQLSTGFVNFGFVRGNSTLHSIYGYSNSTYKVRLEINYTNCFNTLNSGSILPENSTFSTGYVTSSGVKTSGNMLVSSNTLYGRGWARFPLNSIPSNATIISANLKFYTFNGVSSSVSNTITGFTGNPITITGTTLYNTIGNGIALNSSTWIMGTISNPALNNKSLSNIAFIQSQLSSGYINIGLFRSSSNLYSIYGLNNSNNTIALEITYSIPFNATINYNGPLSFCTGGSVLLSANSSPGTIYQWKKDGINIPGATSSAYSASSTGNYTVVLSNNLGCSMTSDSINVSVNQLPSPIISGASSICPGNFSVLSVVSNAGSTYQWKNNGINIIGATNSMFTATSAGSYSVTQTNSYGCTSTSPTFSVIVNPIPVSSISSLNPPTFCQGGSANLIASNNSGLTYQWYSNGNLINGANLPTYTATTSGNYNVFLSNNLGCTNWSSNSISINALATPSLIISGDTLICSGQSTVLSANSDGNVTWNGNQNQSAIQVQPALTTTYTVVALSSNNCQSQEQITVYVGEPTDTNLFISSFGPLVFNGLMYSSSGVFTQTLNNIYGCDSLITLNLNIEVNGVDETDFSKINIFPNPNNSGLFNLDNSLEKEFYIEVVNDQFGRKVPYVLEQLSQSNYSMSIPYIPGIYFVGIRIGDKVYYRKCSVI